MAKSYLIAVLLAVALVAWVASGYLETDARDAPQTPAETVSQRNQPMRVEVRDQQAGQVVQDIVVQGQVEPNRQVEIRAETAGRVTELMAERGQSIDADQPIVRLAIDDRNARLRQAEALLSQREKDYQALQRLGQTGLQAETRVNEARADLEAARATLESIRLDVERTEIKAPFAGILDRRPVEVGSYVAINQAVATIVDNDPLIVSGRVAQQNISKLKTGQQGEVTLATGQQASGRIRYISATADDSTHTFRVELEIENPGGNLPAGVSAAIRLPVATLSAHKVSPALITLSSDGELGVKTVGDDDQVAFNPIDIVRADTGGVWVTGLPERARLITVGQGFVQSGETVEAIAADAGNETTEPAPERESTPAIPGTEPAVATES